MQVNDLIFKELIKRGYSLEGNTRVWNISDSKLWYLTPEQAQAYLSLEQHKDYSKMMFETEIDMLQKHMPKIVEQILHGSGVNIIDIGCGDGKKAVPVIEALYKMTPLRYCPVDISSYMVSRAIDKISQLNKGEVVQFKWNISDFDNLENVSSLLRDHEFRQNFFLFLGNTIGNFEFHEVMYEIAEAMNSGDYLLLGVALKKEVNMSQKVIDAYKSKVQDDFLSMILTNIGFKKEDLELGMRYRNSRVEAYYTVKQNRVITLGSQSINFHKGDQILVAISRRHGKSELDVALKMYFKERKFYVDADKSWALVLCKK